MKIEVDLESILPQIVSIYSIWMTSSFTILLILSSYHVKYLLNNWYNLKVLVRDVLASYFVGNVCLLLSQLALVSWESNIDTNFSNKI